MKITSIQIDKSELENGLDSINMNRLGKIVVLAGKNGSGKSRLLNLIKDFNNTRVSAPPPRRHKFSNNIELDNPSVPPIKVPFDTFQCLEKYFR